MLAVVGDGRSGDPLHERGMLGPEFDKGILNYLLPSYEGLNTSIILRMKVRIIFIS